MATNPMHKKLPRTGGTGQSILPETIKDYLLAKDSIPSGLEVSKRLEAQKSKILKYLKGDESDWDSYKWQMQNRFTKASDISAVLGLSDEQTAEIEKVGTDFRFAISPYYLSLIDPDNNDDAIWRQCMPSGRELEPLGVLDPMDEHGSSPAPCVTRRYPDRLIIKVTNVCGMYCRFCQRRRRIGETDAHEPKEMLELALQYVASQPEIRDVLITGGDAFMLSDSLIDWLLQRLRNIPHVEIIRFGTRTPVTLPQRITKELCDVLKKYHPIFVNTHFNSPMEITTESKAACEMLVNAGIPLGNQMVLLAGVNDNAYVVRKLNQSLLSIRVKPYYIFHPKQVRGTAHFWVTIGAGMEIMEELRGYTSGLAIPTYIVNGPGGLGKTPINPNYLLYFTKDKAVFRSWNGEIFGIDNAP